MTETLVSQLTLNDLQDLIRVEIKQALLELLDDPEEGLELREDLKQRLEQSLFHLTETNPLLRH